jgi:DNA primase catalytic core
MVKISRALSADGVIAYHREEYAANYENYYSESGTARGVWFGREALAFGLEPGSPVGEQHFTRLANGQDPNSGLQLIEWRPAPGEREPRWMQDDQAWRAHLEKLVGDAIADGREVLREHADGPKLPKQKAQRNEEIGLPGEQSDREKALLEMHAIARETFLAHLASDAGAGARQYLKERGIRPDTAKEFGLGLADDSGRQLVERLQHYGPELMEASGLFVKRGHEFVDRFRGRLLFPIENAAGETIAFAGRKPPNEKGPKYINSPETELYRKADTLYNLDRAASGMAETGQVVVVEGYFDAVAAYQAGQRNVVAVSGTALSDSQAFTLAQRANTAILHLDGDEAGRLATEKHMEKLLAAGMNVRAVDLPADPAEWIATNGVREYRHWIREVPPLVSHLSDRALEKFDVTDAYGRIDAIKWMISTLAHVGREHRAQMMAELEAYLNLPKATPEDVEQKKEPGQR